MQKQTLSKNFVEVIHMPNLDEQIQALMTKYSGLLDKTFPIDPRTSEAGWGTTVAAFFDKRKSTNFMKAVQSLDGIGSIRKSMTETTYHPLDLESFVPGKNGALRVMQRGKKRAVTFEPEHQKGSFRYGLVGKTNPRPFWFDSAVLQAPLAPGLTDPIAT